jgi:hypothetical protein
MNLPEHAKQAADWLLHGYLTELELQRYLDCCGTEAEVFDLLGSIIYDCYGPGDKRDNLCRVFQEGAEPLPALRDTGLLDPSFKNFLTRRTKLAMLAREADALCARIVAEATMRKDGNA